MVVLYHGTSKENAIKICEYGGFSLDFSGTSWGSTFGKGIYFSGDINEARVYSGEDGVILSCELDVNGFQLKKGYSPNCRNDRREIKRIVKSLESNGYNCLITKDSSEYIFFDSVLFDNYKK